MKILKLGLAVAVITSLAACGAILNAVVGPQTVDNPIGVLGQGATVGLARAGTVTIARLSPAAATLGTTMSGSAFADGDPLPVAPGAYKIDISFGGTALLATAGTPPDQIVLSGATATVTLSDATSPDVVFELNQIGGDATLRRTTGLEYDLGTSGLTISYTLSGAQLSALTKLLTSGGDNTATATLSVQADTLVAGDSLRLTVTKSTGTITF